MEPELEVELVIEQGNTANELVAIRGGRIFDTAKGQYAEERVIIVRKDRIESLVHEAPPQARLIDLGERVLLPALIDAHTHVFLQGNKTHADFRFQILQEHPSHRVARAVRSLRISLEHGFTWIRDLETEGAGYADVGLRDAVAENVISGPMMQVAGPAMSSTGTYPILGFRPDWQFPSGVLVADGPADCRRAVREQLARGVDCIKLYANAGAGGWLTNDGYIDSAPNWTPEELAAIVSEAHSRGSCVAAHATSDTGVRMAVEAGVDSIEHGYSIRPEMARQMANNGIFFCPTLLPTAYVADERAKERGPIWREAVDVQARSLSNCLKAGVQIAFGTDAGCFPWTEVNQAAEFEFEVQLGMTPALALQSATVVAAELLRIRGQHGRLLPGAQADIIAVPGDPLDDVSVMSCVDFVMQSGQVRRAPQSADPGDRGA